MKHEKSFFCTPVMKEARRLYRSAGTTLLLFLVFFGLISNSVVLPLLRKAWGLLLSTTPDGFLNDANLLTTLVKSPWILPAGFLLLVVYAVLALWQGEAVIIGAAYLHCGQRIRLRDLIVISLRQLKEGIRSRNWMMLVYSLIIMPVSNLYQTNDLISNFVIPEYIQDFIDSQTVLFLLYAALMLFILYTALRWFFLLPSFVLKNRDFKEAAAESRSLTDGCRIRNALSISLYTLVEFIRISLIPAALILLPVTLCFYSTRWMELSFELYRTIGFSIGLELVRDITGTLTQTSILFFLTELYFAKRREQGSEELLPLPELESESKGRHSAAFVQNIICLLLSAMITLTYLLAVFTAGQDRTLILELFGKTEIIAHKGYSSIAPENTMPAFRLADSCEQADLIELDVWSTGDGIPVVIHNDNILDATGIDRQIWDCTFEELKELPAPYAMSILEFPDARIPSLEEVIRECAGSTPLLIEIKGYSQDPELPAKIITLLRKYGCEHTCSIQSGDYAALRAVKEIDPEIRCGLIMAIASGNYYDLPCADFFSIEHTFVSRTNAARIHRSGKEIYVWTVNYDESVEKLRFIGIDGLITDEPEKMASYFDGTNGLFNEILFRSLTDRLENEELEKVLQKFPEGDY